MRLGILGGGQLARMLAHAAGPFGIPVTVLDPAPDACAADAASHIHADYDHADALEELARDCDVVTFEFENVPGAVAERLGRRARVRPPAAAFAAAQDRLAEKRTLEEVGIPVAPYFPVESDADCDAAAEAVGLPLILKTRRFGYDGKGQRRVDDAGDLAAAWAELGRGPAIAEGLIDFDSECSVIAVRDDDGRLACYPLTRNVHRDGILRRSVAPAPEQDRLAGRARTHAAALADHLGYVGVLAIEFFVVDGRLVANEIAPRVHNSGHWTIDGTGCSQFANHVRAVCGLPLGPTGASGASGMLNCIGAMPDPHEVLAVDPDVRYHAYRKAPRPGRKVGHLTVVDADGDAVAARLDRLAAAFDLD